ncbi:MAG: alpha/beta fold hydrolase [Gemmataceae bacterium]
MPRRLWLDWIVCTLVLMLAYAARGWLLAYLLQGRYPWWALLVDVAALAVLVCLFRTFDLGLRVFLHRRLEGRFHAEIPRRWQFGADALRFVIVFAVAAPFLVTLSQLHPQRITCAVHPRDLGLPCEDVTLDADGLALAGWHLPGEEEDRPAVLVTHGVGANKQNFLGVACTLHRQGYHVFLFDFRAHGDSDGAISTLGLREARDVEAAIRWIRARHPHSPLYALGYSMGAAALIQAAQAGCICDKYVLDSTFARLENSARHSMASYYFPPPLISPWWHTSRCWAYLLTGADLQTVCPEEQLYLLADRPIQFIHGESDATTSMSDSVALHERAGPKCELWIVAGAAHLQALLHPEYLARVEQFLAR